MTSPLLAANEAETRAAGAALVARLSPGDWVLLYGELGAGKTTLVRGALEALGFLGAVRSPTYNLVHLYDTKPPVLHADLYRLSEVGTLGLEEYADTHVAFIEWPERLVGSGPTDGYWVVTIEPHEPGRKIVVTPPRAHSIH